MGLVLSRKKGEVINLDNEVYIEIFDLNSSNKAVELYIYNKLTDKEKGYDLPLDGSLNYKWGKNKKINLSVKLNGKSQFKINVEADKNIFIGRDNKISYNSYVDNFENDLIDDDDYCVENPKSTTSSDDLIGKYKDELSWFFQ